MMQSLVISKGHWGQELDVRQVPSAGDHKEASHRVAQSGLRGLSVSTCIILTQITFDGSVDFYFIFRRKKKEIEVLRWISRSNKYFDEKCNRQNTLKIRRKRRRRRISINPTMWKFTKFQIWKSQICKVKSWKREIQTSAEMIKWSDQSAWFTNWLKCKSSLDIYFSKQRQFIIIIEFSHCILQTLDAHLSS